MSDDLAWKRAVRTFRDAGPLTALIADALEARTMVETPAPPQPAPPGPPVPRPEPTPQPTPPTP